MPKALFSVMRSMVNEGAPALFSLATAVALYFVLGFLNQPTRVRLMGVSLHIALAAMFAVKSFIASNDILRRLAIWLLGTYVVCGSIAAGGFVFYRSLASDYQRGLDSHTLYVRLGIENGLSACSTPFSIHTANTCLNDPATSWFEAIFFGVMILLASLMGTLMFYLIMHAGSAHTRTGSSVSSDSSDLAAGVAITTSIASMDTTTSDTSSTISSDVSSITSSTMFF